MTAPVAAPPEPQAPAAPLDAIRAAIASARENLSPDGSSFTHTTPDTPPAETPPVDPNAEPVATGEDVVTEGEQPVEEAPPAEEAPAPLTEDATSVVLAGEDGTQRRLRFATPEDAALVKAATKGAMLRAEYHERLQAVEQRGDEVDLVRDAMQADPVGFVMESVPTELRTELVTALLLEEGVLTPELLQALQTWTEDPDKAKLSRLEIANKRAELRDDMQRTFEGRQQARAALKLTTGVIDTLSERLIADPGLRSTFEQDMLQEVKQWASAYRAKHGSLPALRREHIVQITERRLAVFGIKKDQALATLDPDNPTPPRARPKGPAAERIAQQAEAARNTGKRMVTAAAQRQVAAAVPGGGATASPTPESTIRPPKGLGVVGAAKWARENLRGLWQRGTS